MLPVASCKWGSSERQRFQDLHILESRHRTDLRMYNCNIDHPAGQKYHISKVKYRYQIPWYCKLLKKQKHIVGCWKRDFDKILLTHCKIKSLIWIYRWTHWATRWQPALFRRVGSFPRNRTWVGSSGVLTTRTANLAPVQFGLDPDPDPEWGSGTFANTTHQDQPHKVLRSMKARQECMRPRVGNGRVFIFQNETMSIYTRVVQIYTSCRWVDLCYPCISVSIYIERLR